MAADTGATERLHGARKVGRYALLIFVAFLVLFPIYATLMQALKSGPDAIDHPKSLLPINFTLDTLRAAWRIGDLGRLLLNSVVVAVVVTIGVIITSLLGGLCLRLPRLPRQGPDVRLLPGHVAGAGRAHRRRQSSAPSTRSVGSTATRA